MSDYVPAEAARTWAKKQWLFTALAICFKFGLFHAAKKGEGKDLVIIITLLKDEV